MKNKKSFILNILITLIISSIIFITNFLGFYEKLDLRVYDTLLSFTKDPPMSDKITLLAIDDIDIDKLGDWPWSRDILADTLIRLKELGSEVAIFDIEYINSSPKAVPSNVESNISNKIYETELISQQLIQSIPISAQNGYPVNELPKLAADLINENLFPSYTELYEFVHNNVAFDNDEYFGQALQFFGNTWLTVNNQDLGYSHITKEEIDYIRQRMLIYNVNDDEGIIIKNNEHTFKETYVGKDRGFTPALEKLISRSNGVGFTNSNVDKDGTRRRMELFYEYEGKYLGQLVFAPLMSILDVTDFTRTKNSLILHNALFPDEKERVDVEIPLDENGCILINWQHENDPEVTDSYYGCNLVNVYSLKQLDELEENILKNLNRIYDEYVIIDENGYPLQYVIDIANLIDQYNQLTEYKNHLLSKCTGYDINNQVLDGISQQEYDEYFFERKSFFDNVKLFIEADYLSQINDYLKNILGQSEEEKQYLEDIQKVFNTVKSDITYYNENFNDLKEKLNGKYCLFGMTAASTTDIGAIPFVKQYANVCIHANLMNTILTRNFITPYSWIYAFIFSIIISLILVAFSNTSYVFQNTFGGIVRIVYLLSYVLIFILFKIYIPLVASVIIFNILDYMAGFVYRIVISNKEKRFITQVASSFANKDTVDQLRKNPDLFNTKGEKKVITALFSDVQKFSTLSETLAKIYGEQAPNKLVEILNEYLGDMSNEILYNNGNIDKYEGDAIISMFGAPDPLETHSKEEWAYLCLDSAIRMKKSEINFNKNHKELFEPVKIINEEGITEEISLIPLQTRIGINTGDAYVGLMGSKTESFSKLNYTMMGDTVNLASRLEGVNKVYKTWILCSEDTWNLANSGGNENKIVARRLDKVRVIGRTRPVQLYNILGFVDEMTEEQNQMLLLFNKAMDKYLNKEFMEAGKLFTKASKIGEGDPTSLVFAERCKNYIEKGVSENWDGVMNMTSK